MDDKNCCNNQYFILATDEELGEYIAPLSPRFCPVCGAKKERGE